VTEQKKTEKQDQQDNLIPLSRYRAQLARGQRARRADELFSSSDPEGAIRALPGDEFFYVLSDLGFPDALEVLVHGTAEQVQTVLDFSVWERDRLSMEKSDEWLEALIEASPATLGKWAQGIDIELLALLVRKRARIYDLSLEEEPDETEGVLWNSPDRLFALDLLGEPDQVRVTQHFIDSLYRYSPDLMRRWLVGMRAESDTELEETAYRWRSGRMADLGFVDVYEAMEVYKELDPATVQIENTPPPSLRPHGEDIDNMHLRIPTAMAERMTGKTPFARAVSGLSSRDETNDLHFALTALCNRALSADRVEPSDDEAIRSVLERVSNTLDLAVEFLARGDSNHEVAAVRTVSLVKLHRLGVSLIGKLRRLALTLVRGNPFAQLRPAIDIFDSEDAEILANLIRTRPLFSRILDQPSAAGERPFASLADLAIATRALERAAATIEMVTGLGVRPQQLTQEALEKMAEAVSGSGPVISIDPTSIDTGILARTVLVRRLLGGASSELSALPREVVKQFKQNFNSGTQLTENVLLQALEILQLSTQSGQFSRACQEVASRWISSLCPLGSVLGAGKP
jgi:hypothetical protein